MIAVSIPMAAHHNAPTPICGPQDQSGCPTALEFDRMSSITFVNDNVGFSGIDPLGLVMCVVEYDYATSATTTQDVIVGMEYEWAPTATHKLELTILQGPCDAPLGWAWTKTLDVFWYCHATEHGMSTDGCPTTSPPSAYYTWSAGERVKFQNDLSHDALVYITWPGAPGFADCIPAGQDTAGHWVTAPHHWDYDWHAADCSTGTDYGQMSHFTITI